MNRSEFFSVQFIRWNSERTELTEIEPKRQSYLLCGIQTNTLRGRRLNLFSLLLTLRSSNKGKAATCSDLPPGESEQWVAIKILSLGITKESS